jgi:hypothetical protein
VLRAKVKAISSGGIPIPPSYVKDVLANCFNSGKLQDKSTPPIIKVNAGNI